MNDTTVSESGYLEDTDEVIESIKRIEIALDEERKTCGFTTAKVSESV